MQVSRCGMIYMSPALLGWRPLFNMWLERLPKSFVDNLKALIHKLFETYIDVSLKFLKENMTVCRNASVNALMRCCASVTAWFSLKWINHKPWWFSSHYVTPCRNCTPCTRLTWLSACYAWLTALLMSIMTSVILSGYRIMRSYNSWRLVIIYVMIYVLC